MSAFVLTNAGVKQWLQYGVISRAVGDKYILRLAVNAFTPSNTLAIGDVVECTVPGYAAQGDFNFQTITASGGVALGIWPPWPLTFNAYAGPIQTLTGFYLTDNLNLIVWGSALFTTPIPVPLTGLSLAFTPSATLRIRQ